MTRYKSFPEMLSDISTFIANILLYLTNYHKNLKSCLANVATHSGTKRIVALLFITCKMTQIFGVNEEVLLVHHKVIRGYSDPCRWTKNDKRKDTVKFFMFMAP